MRDSLTTPEPAGLFYRFVVKCDRARNAAIEKAAKAANRSTNQFVQIHFDTILGFDAPACNEPPSTDVLADFEVAKSIGVTVTALRLYRAMDKAKDGNGNVQMSQLMLADAAGIAPASVKPIQVKLIHRRLIDLVQEAGHRTPAIHHVFAIGADR